MAKGAFTLGSLFDLSTQASRKRGWLVTLGCALVFVGVLGASLAIGPGMRWLYPVLGLAFVASVVVRVQRLHDAGRTGYWVICTFVPFLGWVATLIILLLRQQKNAPARAGHPVARRIGAACLGAIFALSVARVFWTPYWIPSENMKPTLLIGDYVVVRTDAGAGAMRGDVVVFRHPVNGSDFIKRLIGLPGDTIQVKDGLVYINGTVAQQVPDGVFEEIYEPQGAMRNTPACENAPVAEGAICTKSRAIETLPNGRKHHVLNIRDSSGLPDNTEVYTVPEGKYFFMGDNRDNSTDSRFAQSAGGVGFVPAENLIGRADRIIFSSAGTSMLNLWTWRSDRYVKAVE